MHLFFRRLDCNWVWLQLSIDYHSFWLQMLQIANVTNCNWFYCKWVWLQVSLKNYTIWRVVIYIYFLWLYLIYTQLNNIHKDEDDINIIWRNTVNSWSLFLKTWKKRNCSFKFFKKFRFEFFLKYYLGHTISVFVFFIVYIWGPGLFFKGIILGLYIGV